MKVDLEPNDSDELTLRRGLRLHLGCGNRFIPGLIHVDCVARPHVDHVGYAHDLPWIADATAEFIYASHLLEHFGRHEYMDVLQEWYRVLRPEGLLRLSVPDFAACAKIYYEEGLRDGLSGLVGLVSGGQRDEYDYHKMIFDYALLSESLRKVGFRNIRRWDWREVSHASVDDYSQAYLPHLDKQNGLHMSLNVEANK